MTNTSLALLFFVMLLSVDAAAQLPRDNQRRASSGTATITGVVMSAESQPRPLRRVRVRISGTELEVSQSTITTDDGRFAFDSLPAGRYAVSASKDGYVSFAFGAVRAGRPGQPVALAAGEYRHVNLRLPRGAVITGILPVSREELQRAMSELQQQRTSSRPGMPAERAVDPSPAPAARRIGISFAPTYYPGTTVTSRATPVPVAVGEVRTGVNFDLDYVPMSTIEGHVAVPNGSRVQLTLATADSNAPYQTNTFATVGGDGRFTFRRVPPGHYVIAARALSTPAPGASALAAILWGRTEVLVGGDDIEGRRYRSGAWAHAGR